MWRIENIRQGLFLDSPNIDDQEHCVFYTNGTTDRPTELNCCRAEWAIVQQISKPAHDPSVNDFIHKRLTQMDFKPSIVVNLKP